MVNTCIKPRPNHRRTMIWLIILACTSSILVLQGSSAIIYLFTREKLSWNLSDFTLYSAFSISSTVVGTLLVAMIQKWLIVKDTLLSIAGYVSAIVQAIITALTNKTWHMYLGKYFSIVIILSSTDFNFIW